MDELLNEPRPRVNAGMLSSHVGKPVTVVGNVDAGKISANGDAFVLTDGEGKNIQIVLDSPLNDIIEGVVEVTGKVDNQCQVQGTMYRVFDSSKKFNMEMYNTTIKLANEFPQFYGYQVGK